MDFNAVMRRRRLQEEYGQIFKRLVNSESAKRPNLAEQKRNGKIRFFDKIEN